jgi:hypothetical protein
LQGWEFREEKNDCQEQIKSLKEPRRPFQMGWRFFMFAIGLLSPTRPGSIGVFF